MALVFGIGVANVLTTHLLALADAVSFALAGAEAFDPVYLRTIIEVSLSVSGTAVLLSTLISLPIALAVGFTDFSGRNAVVSVINTGMGFPSVVVGLVVLFALSNQGPLGGLDLMFTRQAMVLSQVVLATPPITAISLAAVRGVDDGVRDAARVMGGTRLDVALVTLKEARYGIVTAVLAGFGRAISEVGSVLIVGGNIVGPDGVSKTRTLTTAIQREARNGRYETAMVLGAVLIALVLLVNGAVVRLGDRGVQR